VGDGSGGAADRCRAGARALAAIVVLVFAPALAGCVTSSAQQTSGAATFAFESIDGPPRSVFDRLVALLDVEARLQRVAVVSRRGTARYRVRAYLAANVEPSRTVIAWVWDVYDSDLHRAMRITGAETAGGSGKDAWALADERVLARIAESGMARLAAFAAKPVPPAAPSTPETIPEAPLVPPERPPAEEVRVASAAPSTGGLHGRLR